MLTLQPTKIVMRVIILLTLLVGVASAQCGKERWDVKTLTDTGAHSVNFTEKHSSVSALSRLGRPIIKKWPHAPRGTSERYSYEVTGIVTYLGCECGAKGDKDYHIVLKDPSTGEHMVCEIPNPDDCSEVGASSKASKYRSARKRVEDLFGPVPKSITKLPKSKQQEVTFHGVGFWEKKNHGTGHSKNGRELHPVFKVD